MGASPVERVCTTTIGHVFRCRPQRSERTTTELPALFIRGCGVPTNFVLTPERESPRAVQFSALAHPTKLLTI